MDSFLAFLETEKDRMAHLVILGDLFEFLFGFKKTPQAASSPFVFNEYLPVLKQLQRLSERGICMTYMEGNHDFRLKSFFQEHFEMKVEVHPRGADMRLGDKRVYLAHGDLSNPRQWKYRTLRRILKNPITYGLIDLVDPSFTRRVAEKLNGMSYQRVHRSLPSNPPSAFRTFAHQKFLEDFDVVILGHSHIPEEVDEWVDGRRCLYFNVGDWRVHRSFLRYTPPDVFRLLKFEENKSGLLTKEVERTGENGKSEEQHDTSGGIS